MACSFHALQMFAALLADAMLQVLHLFVCLRAEPTAELATALHAIHTPETKGGIWTPP